MKKLIAAMPILYRGRMYQTGDRLPGDDANMVEAWLRNKSAKWDSAEDLEPPQDGRKAVGVSQDQEPENGAQNETEPTGEGKNEGGGTISGHSLAPPFPVKPACGWALTGRGGEEGAMDFKDCVAGDIHGVFLNRMEFADTHTIDGREMDAVVDDDALLERDAARGGVHSDGIYRVRRLLYVAKADYGGRPPSGKRLNLDGREYRVVQADDAAGMLTIEIEANRT